MRSPYAGFLDIDNRLRLETFVHESQGAGKHLQHLAFYCLSDGCLQVFIMDSFTLFSRKPCIIIVKLACLPNLLGSMRSDVVTCFRDLKS